MLMFMFMSLMSIYSFCSSSQLQILFGTLRNYSSFVVWPHEWNVKIFRYVRVCALTHTQYLSLSPLFYLSLFVRRRIEIHQTRIQKQTEEKCRYIVYCIGTNFIFRLSRMKHWTIWQLLFAETGCCTRAKCKQTLLQSNRKWTLKWTLNEP